MNCERCKRELFEHEKRGLLDKKSSRPTCPTGGPHKLQSVDWDKELENFNWDM